MSNAKILLLNAGSSSLKCVLMEADPAPGIMLVGSRCRVPGRKVIAHHLVDWAGPVTRYKFVGPDGREHSDEVAWRGAAEGVRRVLHDLTAQKIAQFVIATHSPMLLTFPGATIFSLDGGQIRPVRTEDFRPGNVR